MIRVLSRLPERSMFGLNFPSAFEEVRSLIFFFTNFSNEVAKLVTHPLWPLRVPRITNCSPMLGKKKLLSKLKGRVDCKHRSRQLWVISSLTERCRLAMRCQYKVIRSLWVTPRISENFYRDYVSTKSANFIGVVRWLRSRYMEYKYSVYLSI